MKNWDIEEMEKEMTARKEYHINSKRIVKTDNGYSVQQMDSHYSDSYNSKGDWVEYWSELKEYKTLNGAIKGLVKYVDCHFPKDYDITENKNAIVRKIV